MSMERDRYQYPEHQYLCGELKPCPFCGASGHTYLRKYPNGDVSPSMMMWHDENCPLEHMLECFDDYEDEQALADAWNRRWEDA